MSIDQLQKLKLLVKSSNSGSGNSGISGNNNNSGNFNSPFKPKETVNPQTFQAVTLDDISVKLSKLFDLETIKLGVEKKRLDVEKAILKELQDRRDQGKELPQSGTVLSTDYTFIDLGQLRQGQKAKSFELLNDDPNNDLYFGWNTSEAGLQPSLDDPQSSLSKFRILGAGESIKIKNNVDTIENIALLGKQGDVVFRLWFVW
jgi:hypothetical protein